MLNSMVKRALLRTGLNERINRRQRLDIDGHVFEIPVLNGLKAYASEGWLTDVLRRLLGLRPGAFIDVGVNLGQTLLKVAAIAPEREYVGFEPNPACVAYVEKLVAANGLTTCIVVPVGLARQTGILTLSVYGNDADSSGSLIPDFRPTKTVSGRKFVPVFSVGDLPEGIIPAAVALIKIDVEGAELSVMEGLRPLIEDQRPLLVMEVLPCYSDAYPDRIDRQAELERLVADLSYRLFRIIRNRAHAFERLEAIDGIGIHGDLERCDYVLCPVEDLAALARVFPVGEPGRSGRA